MKMQNYKDIDEYISNFPSDVQKTLQELRKVIQKEAPEGSEKIAYGIPTFAFHGNLVHFAAYDTHIGFYPGSVPIEVFKDELKGYETAKGTVRFPLDKPLPLELVKKIVRAAIERNRKREK